MEPETFPDAPRRRNILTEQMSGQPRGPRHYGYRVKPTQPTFYRRHGSVVNLEGKDYKAAFDEATAIYGRTDDWTIEPICDEPEDDE